MIILCILFCFVFIGRYWKKFGNCILLVKYFRVIILIWKYIYNNEWIIVSIILLKKMINVVFYFFVIFEWFLICGFFIF